jgi:hypothetical protein
MKNKQSMTIEQTIYDMMMTSTGMALCDSGFGERGRAWQRNKLDYPTIELLQASEPVEFEQPEQYYTVTDQNGQFIRRFTNEIDANEYAHANNWLIEKKLDSSDINYTVNVYHHLVNSLDLDNTCHAFNALKCKDWDSEKAYGISEKQEKWLENHGLVIGDTWNSYSGESSLSQTLQGANVNLAGDESNFEYPTYILLQLHQGADVRGGYTDAKLFKVTSDSGYFDTNPTVYGDIDGVQVDTAYNGYSLTNEDGEPVPVKSDSVISLYTY